MLKLENISLTFNAGTTLELVGNSTITGNVQMLGGYGYEVQLFGETHFLMRQGFALLALIPIWLYRGNRGYHSKWFQYFCYAFYPVHMLLLCLPRLLW